MSSSGLPFRQLPVWGELDPASELQGFGQCLWNVEANKTLKAVPSNGATTLVEALVKSKDTYSSRRAVGWRELVEVHQVEEGGAKREKLEYANEYQWMTYSQYYERVLCLARGFAMLGLAPQSKVVMYAETQRDWLASAFAVFHSNAQIVTIYATLGPEGASHGINETEASMIVADVKLLKSLVKVLHQCKDVKTIVTMTPCDPALKGQVEAAGVKVMSMDEVFEQGKTYQFKPQLPQSEDVAIIMYTSGTTGTPKGVVLKHSNVVASLACVEHAVSGLLTCEDVYQAYLPLAHIMELVAEVCFMSLGLSLGFGSPHTLTDTGVKLKRPESMGDAPCLQPTFMVFAPAVLDKVYQGIQTRRDHLGKVSKKLFDWGLHSGERHHTRGQVGANVFLNTLVFRKVQNLVGGRLKACVTGSAPLSADIQRFIQTVLNVPVRQGYGLTETCAVSAFAFWGDNSTSTVGPPTVSTVMRLADWPEGNYLNSDKDKPGIGMPRGEVLIGGPSVSEGYYISPSSPNPELVQKNKEDWITLQGVRYFRTGDIGQIRKDGSLQIIDRKKDLWKGPNGEYVALTKVEAALKLCDYVDMPMVYGRTGSSYPVALLCPQKRRIEELGSELSQSGDFPALCGNDKVVSAVAKACQSKCKEQKLAEFEVPKKFALVADPWTPENDLLTAAMKLKRPLIAEKHKDAIDKMYA
mmetsp:Transcript_15916/g.37539  ORF Transcript_15916/g.37539 Transcript_15916/m.37539 type:complete len:695 (+) Transcript_15916:96-2180(+)